MVKRVDETSTLQATGSDGQTYTVRVMHFIEADPAKPNEERRGERFLLVGRTRVNHIGGGRYQLDGKDVFFDGIDTPEETRPLPAPSDE